MLLVTAASCAPPPAPGAPARAVIVSVHAGSPAIALRGAALLQAASPPDTAIAAAAMMVFNNDPESARIDPCASSPPKPVRSIARRSEQNTRIRMGRRRSPVGAHRGVK